MRLFGLAVCTVLALGACGGRTEAPKAQSDVDGVRGFLKQAFSRDDGAAVVGGGLCGDPALVGEAIGKVPGNGVCGIDNAVRLRAVGDVQLSQPATIDCQTARALKKWLVTGAKPAVGKRGGGVTGLRVAAHYACRTRNNQPGAKVSEHGKGKAIDIAAVQLADGSELSVLQHWGGGKDGKALKKMHSAACGPFGTVLGPKSDRFHQDHFHFDTASHRGGPYCR
ncbi:extensin-like domain-containing protein [Tropicibacter oceani]|uniref:Extensin family protein n=1 Tax=Tropicibacter oceani TaxID=3058420 RepID=A0ABY8QJZ5_9RHOB|nr:extensin family protein [Tropicibacter oceani]WGW04328.1 extensin family protein [Tropicibacter oceani]